MLSGTEIEILRVVAIAGNASRGEISQTVGFSLAYVEMICKYLIRKGYLSEYNRRYLLTPEGEKSLCCTEGNSLVKNSGVLNELMNNLAQEMVKKINIDLENKSIKRNSAVKSQQAYRKDDVIPVKRKIQIKTGCFLPVTDESIGLETNIDELKVKVEKERKGTLEESVKTLKRMIKGGRDEKGRKNG